MRSLLFTVVGYNILLYKISFYFITVNKTYRLCQMFLCKTENSSLIKLKDKIRLNAYIRGYHSHGAYCGVGYISVVSRHHFRIQLPSKGYHQSMGHRFWPSTTDCLVLQTYKITWSQKQRHFFGFLLDSFATENNFPG